MLYSLKPMQLVPVVAKKSIKAFNAVLLSRPRQR
jgi:hypothetical protein